MSDCRRSARLSLQSTTSDSDEPWYLIFLPKVGTDGSYAVYTQSQFKITQHRNGLESIRTMSKAAMGLKSFEWVIIFIIYPPI
jgi:hypothetical protein